MKISNGHIPLLCSCHGDSEERDRLINTVSHHTCLSATPIPILSSLSKPPQGCSRLFTHTSFPIALHFCSRLQEALYSLVSKVFVSLIVLYPLAPIHLYFLVLCFLRIYSFCQRPPSKSVSPVTFNSAQASKSLF